jgi:hypothetical protein
MAQPATSAATLRAETGPLAGQQFPLHDGATIGRQAGNTIVLDDGQTSRQHARLEVQGGRVVIRDLGSANGTRVNGATIAGPRALRPGDEIAIGGSTFRLEAASIPSAGSTAAGGAPSRRLPLLIGGILAVALLCACGGVLVLFAATRDAGDGPAATNAVAAQPPAAPPTNPPASAPARPAGAPGPTPAQPTAAPAPTGNRPAAGGTHRGTVQSGYEVAFVVSDDGRTIGDIYARIRWQCNDRSTPQDADFLPEFSVVVREDGSFAGTGRDPAGEYEFSGQLRGASASGTLRMQYAGGGQICDSRRLTWTAERQR